MYFENRRIALKFLCFTTWFVRVEQIFAVFDILGGKEEKRTMYAKLNVTMLKVR